MIDLSTHELSAWELFTTSWRTFFKNIKNYRGLLLIYALIGTIIGGLTAGIFWLLGGFDPTKADLSSYSTISIIIMALVGIIAKVAFIYIAIIYTIALMYMIHQNLIGNIISIKSAIEYGKTAQLSKFFSLGLIKSLYLIGLTLLLIIPGIIYSLYWMFTSQAFIVDGQGYPEALDASKALVKNRRWKLFGKLLLIGLIYLGIFLIIGIPVGLLVGIVFGSGSTPGQELPEVVSIIGSIIQQIITQSATIAGVIISMMIYLNWKNIYGKQAEQQTEGNITPIITENQ